MSFGGILATALAGGAGVIGKQAGDDIEATRRVDLMKQQAEIEEQTQQRLAEMRQRLGREQLLWETTGGGGAAKLDLDRRTREQANAVALQGKVDEAKNPELTKALDERAEAELQREIRKIQATAKPEAEKAAAIAEARARAEAKYRKADPTVQSKIADLEKALGRPLTEQEKLGAMGLADKRNPELDTVTIEEISGDPMGAHTKTTRKEVRKPGQGGAKPEADDPYAVPKGAAKAANAPAAKPVDRPAMLSGTAPDDPARYKVMSDGSGRMVDTMTGRTLSPEQSEILQKIQRGEPTTPRERAMLKG